MTATKVRLIRVSNQKQGTYEVETCCGTRVHQHAVISSLQASYDAVPHVAPLKQALHPPRGIIATQLSRLVSTETDLVAHDAVVGVPKQQLQSCLP
jgi:hypothetical protein